MPCEVFFNRAPQWEDRVDIGTNIRVDQIEDEHLDESEDELLDESGEGASNDLVRPIFDILVIFLTLPSYYQRHHFQTCHHLHQWHHLY